MSDTTSFRITLRQMADAEDASDRRRLYDLLASQIEVALNNHANNTQVVLWDVQEKAYRKIDALHEHQADTNLLLVSVADSLAQIQASVQQVLSATQENARGLGKITERVDAHAGQLKDIIGRLDRKREQLQEHGDRLKALEQRNERLDAIERRLAELEHPQDQDDGAQ